MLFLFLKSLRYRWFEYVLATVIITVIVAAITVQRSLSLYSETQVHDLAHSLGKNMLVVPVKTNLSDFYAFEYSFESMPDFYLEKLRDSDAGKHIKFIQSRLYGNLEINNNSFVIVGERNMQRGAVYNPILSGNVFLPEEVSKQLGVKKFDMLNIKGKISNLQLTVDDVISTPPEGLNTGLFTSLDVAQEILDKPGEINAMRLAGCWCSIDVSALAVQVERFLSGTRALTIEGMIKAQKGTVAVVKRYSGIIDVVAIFLIAGIMIILTSSQVRRQKKDIGFLLAIGTSPWMITALFVIKAAIVGALGGLLGYLLGNPITHKIAASLIGASLPMPEGGLTSIFIFSIIVSSISALIPAVCAARIDPIEILREV